MEGAKLALEFKLRHETIEVRGVVIFSYVPGNLQRPNLPLGMGVRFEGLDRQTEKLIIAYLEERAAELNV